MKTYRQIVLLFYCAAVLGACLYVPWKVNIRDVHITLGYSFLWKPMYASSIQVEGKFPSRVDIHRAVLGLVAVTAITGGLLLAGELGKTVWPLLSLRLWLPNKVALSVFVASTLVGWGIWDLYGRWQEKLRLQKVAEQKTICEALSDRCTEDNNRSREQALKEGKPTTLRMWLLGCDDKDKAYSECVAKVRELQTEDERRAEESQH